MAWRIHESVIRGELDNRVKGFVHGKLWLAGMDEPVVLKLKGNCHPDLAGCRLEFKNPLAPVPLRKDAKMALEQAGTAGDITASRKVRVFDIPLEEAMAMLRRGEKPPEHMANCLYLEWFSAFNGRVVVESAEYHLTVSAPEWRLTPQEDQDRARQAAEGMDDFMRQLTEAIEKHERAHPSHEEDWDEHDYEKFLKECDARTDKYMELLEKYGESDEAEEKIAKEMGWDTDDGDTGESGDKEDAFDVEEMNRICEEALNEPEPEPDPSREGIDWVRTEDGDLKHPLQHRCHEAAMKFWDACDELGLEDAQDEDLAQVISEFQITGAKLAGALNGIATGRNYTDAAFTVAYLKRALDHLHKAQAGLEAVAPKKLLPAQFTAATRRDLFDIREGILKLMDEFRGR
jgi:hypothetical protein